MPSQVKAKVAQKTIQDPDLMDMFNQMIGNSDPNPSVVLPKYKVMLGCANDIINVLKSFATSPFSKQFREDFQKGFSDVDDFVAKSRTELKNYELVKNDKVLSGNELNSINADPSKIQEYLANMEYEYKVTDLGVKYRQFKECITIQEMIMLARNIKNAIMLEKERTSAEINNLENRDNLSADFIHNADGDFLVLFNFTSLDFKQLIHHPNMGKGNTDYLLYVLHILYKKSLAIVKEVTSPDIDIDTFSAKMVDSIDQVRSQIPRCDKAFDKIKQSVGLLKNNFGEYYKDFISSKNPSIIIEDFITDVAKSYKGDALVMKQFNDIVNFYRKNAKGKIKDPKAQKMVDLLGQNFDILSEKKKQENAK